MNCQQNIFRGGSCSVDKYHKILNIIIMIIIMFSLKLWSIYLHCQSQGFGDSFYDATTNCCPSTAALLTCWDMLTSARYYPDM